MTNAELTSVLLLLLLLVGLVQLLGTLFVTLRQPKVIGEILAGVVLGPALLSRQSNRTSAAWRRPSLCRILPAVDRRPHFARSEIAWNTKNEMPSGSSGEVIGIRGKGATQPQSASKLVSRKLAYLKYARAARHTMTPTTSQVFRAPGEVLLWMSLAPTPATTEIPISN